MPTIGRDDARRVLWFFGDRSEQAIEPDRFQKAIIDALDFAYPRERSRLTRLHPSLAAAVDLATGCDDGLDRLRAVVTVDDAQDSGEPTHAEQALATLYFHLSQFQILKMSSEEREAYGDAVDKVFRYDDPEDFEPIARWWHEDYVLGT